MDFQRRNSKKTDKLQFFSDWICLRFALYFSPEFHRQRLRDSEMYELKRMYYGSGTAQTEVLAGSWRTLLHMRRADAVYALTRWLRFYA